MCERVGWVERSETHHLMTSAMRIVFDISRPRLTVGFAALNPPYKPRDKHIELALRKHDNLPV